MAYLLTIEGLWGSMYNLYALLLESSPSLTITRYFYSYVYGFEDLSSTISYVQEENKTTFIDEYDI